MKRILITGANSYIGTSFENYMKQFGNYQIDTVDMIDGSWRNKDFSEYDIVFHVAGIAHSDFGKVTDEIKQKYYAINTELTIETAKKAKSDGVNQFVFMSSMMVFGTKNERITKSTKPKPDNFYGDSKLQADIGIHQLEDTNFRVVSLRPPMIYGKDSKGNYPKLAKLAKITPIFPDYNNKRSMLYIENLCMFIKLIIDNNESGYFYPQNDEYVKTSELVKDLSVIYGKNILLTKILSPIIAIAKWHPIVKKVFGNLYYDQELSVYSNYNYCTVDFIESLKRTEINI